MDEYEEVMIIANNKYGKQLASKVHETSLPPWIECRGANTLFINSSDAQRSSFLITSLVAAAATCRVNYLH